MDRAEDDAPKDQDTGDRDSSGVEPDVPGGIARMQRERQAAAKDALFSMTGEERAKANTGPEERRVRRLQQFLADRPNAIDESLETAAEAEAQVPDPPEEDLVVEEEGPPESER